MSRTAKNTVTFEKSEISQSLQRFYPASDSGRGYEHAMLLLNDLFAETDNDTLSKARVKESFLRGQPT